MYYKKIYYKIYQEFSVNNFGKLENINENKKKNYDASMYFLSLSNGHSKAKTCSVN